LLLKYNDPAFGGHSMRQCSPSMVLCN